LNKTKFVLTCLIEECAEVQHRACQVLKFGLDGCQNGKPTNRKGLRDEMIDLLAMLAISDSEFTQEISLEEIELQIERKVKRINDRQQS